MLLGSAHAPCTPWLGVTCPHLRPPRRVPACFLAGDSASRLERGGGWPGQMCNRNCHTHLFLAPPGKPPVLTCRQAHPHSEIISSLGPGISKEALAPTAYSLGWVLSLIPRSGAPCQRARPVQGGTDRWVWTVWRTSSSTSWNDPPTELGEGHPYARSVQSVPQSSRVRSLPCLDSAPSCVPESSARPHHCPLHRRSAAPPGGSSSLTSAPRSQSAVWPP